MKPNYIRIKCLCLYYDSAIDIAANSFRFRIEYELISPQCFDWQNEVLKHRRSKSCQPNFPDDAIVCGNVEKYICYSRGNWNVLGFVIVYVKCNGVFIWKISMREKNVEKLIWYVHMENRITLRQLNDFFFTSRFLLLFMIQLSVVF